MSERFKFDRMELAGSLGDLGTLLPIAIALVLFNGVDPVGLFLSFGLAYVATGIYFGVTVPVQPMKVIGAYAIATGLSADRILASSLLMGAVLLIVGATGAIDNRADVESDGPIVESDLTDNVDIDTISIGELPRTGSDLLRFAVFGLLLLLAGAALVVGSKHARAGIR